jgi:(S)-sulfolactate dehydrogenase
MVDIVITEFMDESAVGALKAKYDALYDPNLADDQTRIPALLADARALIVRNRTKVSADLLASAPNLQCVGRLGVGLDNIDQPACGARDVTVYPATGANNLSVAEYVITSAAILLRGAYARQEQMLSGAWPRQEASGKEISGKSLGLVGYGAIARDTATIGRALGMTILAYDPYLPDDSSAWEGATRLDLDQVLASSDIVSLHVPLTAETRHLIDAPALKTFKPGAILVNAARGGVVDEEALVQAMKTGQLSGAALDVFETEPLGASAAEKFAGIPNLILTPHIGGVTQESNERVSALIADRVSQHLER